MSENINPQQEENNDLPEEIKEILDNPNISEEQKEVIESLTIERSFSGPLPSPEVLQQYNHAVKDGAERVVKMAENQSKHRMEMEKHAISKQLEQSGRGQLFGFILALICLASTVFLAVKGFETLASILGSSTIIGLVGIFVTGKYFQSKEQEE